MSTTTTSPKSEKRTAAAKSPTSAGTKKVRPIPEGMHTVTPFLICAGAAEAIDFYKRAFNATEMVRLPDAKTGRLMYAAVRIGDSVVMLTDEHPGFGGLGPKSLKGTPVTIHLYVENVDAFFEQAINVGGQVRMPVQDMFWGDRYGVLEDPFGHHWSVATHTRDLTPEEVQKAAAQACG